MRTLRSGVSSVLFVCALITISALAQSNRDSSSSLPTKEIPVTMHASGPFDVKTNPIDDKSGDPVLGRFSLDKQYHGDLDGTGTGQMLTAGTAVKGSGAYVAIEKVGGTLKGRTGTFVLQHAGSMSGGNFQLNVTIVPDSGTGQLVGIAGKMTITIAPGGKHSYDLEYTLPNTN